MRGDELYERPKGWYRMALKVKGKYPDGDTWLGTKGWRRHSVPGEWPVSYHGTSLDGAKGIIRSHYKAGDRSAYGRGIYSTPDIHVAERERYAKSSCKIESILKTERFAQNHTTGSFAFTKEHLPRRRDGSWRARFGLMAFWSRNYETIWKWCLCLNLSYSKGFQKLSYGKSWDDHIWRTHWLNKSVLCFLQYNLLIGCCMSTHTSTHQCIFERWCHVHTVSLLPAWMSHLTDRLAKWFRMNYYYINKEL